LTGGCYSILLGLDDGSTRTAIVVLKSNDDLATANARPGRSDHNGQIDSANNNRRAWRVVERWDEHKQKLELRLVSKTRKK
jgi:activator of 2-hydroxyglutaryl-CoA dehydratase